MTTPIMHKRSHWVYLVMLVSIASLLIFLGIGWRYPWPADEPRFALIAKEMVETGQWFFPTRGGEYYPDKPPVFMWSIAVFYWLTGNLSIAFLLPSALSAVLTLVLVYDLGKRLWNAETGLIAAALLTVSMQFIIQAKAAQIDAMVCALITLGCYGTLRFMLVDGSWRWFYIGCFGMGIGVITKGVGFLPILLIIPYALFRYFSRQPSVVTSGTLKHWLCGPALMLFAIGLWFVPMLILVWQSGDPALIEYRDNILFKQTVTRYADAWHHIKPFYYYLTTVIPGFWLPLSLIIPWLIPHWWRAIRAADARIILPLAWIALVLIFFSISAGKRGVYILPALPMLALISAPYMKQILQGKWVGYLLVGLSCSLASALLVFGLAGLFGLDAATRLAQTYDIEPWWFFISVGLMAIAMIISTVRVSGMPWLAWPTFFTIVWIGYSSWGYALMNPVRTPLSIFDAMAEHVSTTTDVGLVDFSEQFILFSPYRMTHFGYHTPLEAEIRSAYQWLNESPDRVILTAFDDLSGRCFDPERAVHLGFAHRRDWVLLTTQSMLESCEPPPMPVKKFTFTAERVYP